jgi:hypothetical protein
MRRNSNAITLRTVTWLWMFAAHVSESAANVVRKIIVRLHYWENSPH